MLLFQCTVPRENDDDGTIYTSHNSGEIMILIVKLFNLLQVLKISSKTFSWMVNKPLSLQAWLIQVNNGRDSGISANTSGCWTEQVCVCVCDNVSYEGTQL